MPGAVAVTRTIGAVGSEPRRSAVRSPAKATARSIAGLLLLEREFGEQLVLQELERREPFLRGSAQAESAAA